MKIIFGEIANKPEMYISCHGESKCLFYMIDDNNDIYNVITKNRLADYSFQFLKKGMKIKVYGKTKILKRYINIEAEKIDVDKNGGIK